MTDYPSAPSPFNPERAAEGRRLLAAGIPISAGDPALRYLVEHRQLPAAVVLAGPDLLYLPSAAHGRGPTDHAVLTILRSEPAGEPTGIQLTWIDIAGAPAPTSDTLHKRDFFPLVEKGCGIGCWWAGGEGEEIVAVEGYLEKPLALLAADIPGRIIGFGPRGWLKFKWLRGRKLTIVTDRAPAKEALGRDGRPLLPDHLRDYGADVDHWLLNGFHGRVWITSDPTCDCCKDADDIWRAHGGEAVLEFTAHAMQGELGRPGWVIRLARIDDELERAAAIKEAMSEAIYQGVPLFKGIPVKLLREHVATERERLRPTKPDPDRPDAEPWDEPVDLAVVLDELVVELTRYFAISAANLDTAALWCAMSHIFEFLECMPKLALQSPTKQCGKTTLLDALSNTVRRPELVSGVTEASFIRVSDAWQPTWLLDEADRYLNPKSAGEALTAAINASAYRRAARKKVCVPNPAGGWDIHDFTFWCPMILAGIRELVDTVQDRAIVLVMQRARPGELKHRLVNGTSPTLEAIGRKLARWAKDLSEIDLDPWLPVFLHNREADLWRPLFAIAALAGEGWPERVLAAARTIHGQRTEDEAQLAMLLEAIRDEFGTSERMFTADLVARLIAREGEPWATVKRNGGPIDAYYLRGMLRGVIERDPNQKERQRSGNRDRRVYTRANFVAAWARYIPVTPVNDPAHPADPAPEAVNPPPEPDSVEPDQNEPSGPIRRRRTRPDKGNSSGAGQAFDPPTENGVEPDGPDQPDQIRPAANTYPAAGNGSADPGAEHAPGEKCGYCGGVLGQRETGVRHDGMAFHLEACLAEHLKKNPAA